MKLGIRWVKIWAVLQDGKRAGTPLIKIPLPRIVRR